MFALPWVRCATGGILWTYQAAGVIEDSAAVDSSGRMYFTSDDGVLHQLWAENGTELWSVNFQGLGLLEASSPALCNNEVKIYVGSYVPAACQHCCCPYFLERTTPTCTRTRRHAHHYSLTRVCSRHTRTRSHTHTHTHTHPYIRTHTKTHARTHTNTH